MADLIVRVSPGMEHRITRFEAIEPDGIEWVCCCGATGWCPRSALTGPALPLLTHDGVIRQMLARL